MQTIDDLITEYADRNGITGEEAKKRLRQELGIRVPQPQRRQRRWTEEEERFLWDHRDNLPFVAVILERALTSVRGKWQNYDGILYGRYGQDGAQ